jgi:ADP-heptose:LPS heptosyltransferase
VTAAASALGTSPTRCLLVGDIGRDMAAAGVAGAAAILVPTPVTRPEEIAAAPSVAGDLGQAVDQILRRQRLVAGSPDGGAGPGARHVLVVRADSAGDLLLTGPAIRAVAARASRVTLLCGPRGRAAAQALPGVDGIIEWPVPWLDPQPPPVDPTDVHGLVERIAQTAPDEAIIFTSFHQSPLPMALLLRLAGVRHLSAISDDYPGSLLDVRHRVPLGLPEPERALSLAAAAGYPLPEHDDPGLRVHAARFDAGPPGYVVVHPGASVPARACPPQRCAEMVRAVAHAGHRVLVTGSPDERELTRFVAGEHAEDLGGRTTLRELAGVLAGAACAVVANTGPAHLAAAVGTPVVSLFAPTVPFGQWGPYRVPWIRLGQAAAPCRDTRATRCPVPGHPCLTDISADEVVHAIERLVP